MIITIFMVACGILNTGKAEMVIPLRVRLELEYALGLVQIKLFIV